MYVRRLLMIQTPSFDIFMDWIVIPSIDHIVSIQLLIEYWRRMNRSNMAQKSNSILFQCSFR
jgi:hypothetical protein